MKTIHLVVLLGTVALAYGQGKKLITGVFIPSAAFQDLENRANANSPNYQPPNTNQQQYRPYQQPTYQQTNYQPANPNQQQYRPYQQPNQQPVMTNQQPPVINNQPPRINTQAPVITNQPVMNRPIMNQPVMNQPMRPNMQPVITNQPTYQQPMTANREPNSPIVVMTRPSQPANRPIVVVQQPSPNQPMYVQPAQTQPTQVIIASNPGNTMQGTLMPSPNQNQPGSTVYTLIPLSGQNTVNTRPGTSYLIPVQSGNSNPIIVRTGQ